MQNHTLGGLGGPPKLKLIVLTLLVNYQDIVTKIFFVGGGGGEFGSCETVTPEKPV